MQSIKEPLSGKSPPRVQNRITSDSRGSLPGHRSLLGDVHKVLSYFAPFFLLFNHWWLQDAVETELSIFSTSLKKTAHHPFSVLSFYFAFPEDTGRQVSLCVYGSCMLLIAASLLLSPSRDADLAEEPSSAVRREAASPGLINNHK